MLEVGGRDVMRVLGGAEEVFMGRWLGNCGFVRIYQSRTILG